MSWLVIEFTAIDSIELAHLAHLANEVGVTQHAHGPTLESALAGVAIPADDALACVRQLEPRCDRASAVLDLDDQVAPVEWTPGLEAEAKLQGESPEAADAMTVVDDGDSPDEPTELE